MLLFLSALSDQKISALNLFKNERHFRLIKIVTLLPQSFEDDKTFFRQKLSIDTLSPE